MSTTKTPQAIYEELVAAIVKAVPKITLHNFVGGDNCVYCGNEIEATRVGMCEKGRPITIEDVFLWLNESGTEESESITLQIDGSFDDGVNEYTAARWNLGHDLAWHRDNAPKTISFLHSFLRS